MKVFVAIAGLLMILSGIALGLYVGLWLCFVGGIVQVISSVTPAVVPLGIGVGILKIFCTGIAGWLSAFALVIPGVGFLSASLS